MRLNKIERVVPLSAREVRQRVTVLCENDPKRLSNYALQTNQERISFTVNGPPNSVVYAMVSGNAQSEDEGSGTMMTIKTYIVQTNWPIFLAIYVAIAAGYYLMFKPETLEKWLPIIVLVAGMVNSLFVPLLKASGDEKKLVRSIQKLLDGLPDQC